MRQAEDFWQETLALAAVLDELDDGQYAVPTQFKGWTINDVLGHLHIFNHAANLSLEASDSFDAFFAPLRMALTTGGSPLEAQYAWLAGLSGRALRAAWLSGSQETARNFSKADPKARLRWVGPEMSARTFMSARQMETWAHGQEVFDLLGLVRQDTDRIRNIAHLGVAAYGWTFANRKMDVLEPPPYVKLTAPSGDCWEWNQPQRDNFVEGAAVEFCQIVTQVRNVADTTVRTAGTAATRWMALAQCFAGSPTDPPPPGTRTPQSAKPSAQ